MRRLFHIGFVAGLMVLAAVDSAVGQETIFGLLKRDEKLADEYMSHGRYADAVEIYSDLARNGNVGKEIKLRIAQCHYKMGSYRNAIYWYSQCEFDDSFIDIFRFAESYTAVGDHQNAIDQYKKCLAIKPDDVLITRKIWQLQNAHYLFEDSIHYALRPVGFNTTAGEMCPVPYDKGVVFMSNRRRVKAVDKIDASSREPFYRLYYAPYYTDTITFNGYEYQEGKPFKLNIPSRFNAGPVRFYAGETKMVYVSNSSSPGNDGSSTLQLFFAERSGDEWRFAGAFPCNSKQYSISDPAISEDGQTLYFSSDMPGGFGGKDIYRSNFINGRWTEPYNLGDHVNTLYDEVFPYWQNDNILYFSSNGHAGLGGLDIFKTIITDEGVGEITNMGYPVNTHYDEFGIILDSLSTHGYITSNRGSHGTQDDIYEFDMDVQTYPLVLSGVISYKQYTWSDSTQLKPFANASLHVIDNLRNVTVYEERADAAGRFSLHIPYFSKYKIRVIGEDNEENIVSLEIPKHRKAEGKHQIVVVKDPFAEYNNQVVK